MQQHLIFTGDYEHDWRIDEHTRTAGRRGIAAARATLAACHHDETLPRAA
jgi:hypothetical protein